MRVSQTRRISPMRNKKLGILLLVLLMLGVGISILSLYLGDSKRGDVDISFV